MTPYRWTDPRVIRLLDRARSVAATLDPGAVPDQVTLQAGGVYGQRILGSRWVTVVQLALGYRPNPAKRLGRAVCGRMRGVVPLP